MLTVSSLIEFPNDLLLESYFSMYKFASLDLSFDTVFLFYKYKLVRDPANWVTVDEKSGVVTTRKQID
jgi:hypothetical protein